MKKTTSTKRKLVLARETVKALVTKLEAHHLHGIQGGVRRLPTMRCPQCTEDHTGCGNATIISADC